MITGKTITIDGVDYPIDEIKAKVQPIKRKVGQLYRVSTPGLYAGKLYFLVELGEQFAAMSLEGDGTWSGWEEELASVSVSDLELVADNLETYVKELEGRAK
jgi:hypothetical protein